MQFSTASCLLGDVGPSIQVLAMHNGFYRFDRPSFHEGYSLRKTITFAVRLLFIAAMSFIMYEATIPKPFDPQVSNGDKLLHALAFFSLSMLADFSFPGSGFGFMKVLLVIGFGFLIEYVQSFLPWRSSDFADILADGAGLFVYILVIPLLRQLPLIRRRWAN